MKLSSPGSGFAILSLCLLLCAAGCGGSAHVAIRSAVASPQAPVASAASGAPPLATIPPAADTATPPPAEAVADGPAVAVYRGRTDTNAVALTFDAGADTGYAALILDTLERNSIHATFGMTGHWAVQNAALVRRMAADGDELMNHTWDHQSFTGVSTQTRALGRNERWGELDQTEAAVRALTGQTTLPYFRAPFGDADPSVDADVGARGYRFDVLWTVDTRGWAGASVGQIIAKCAAGASPGAIIVMHVGAESQDGPALQGVIDAIRQKGLDFASIRDLVGPS